MFSREAARCSKKLKIRASLSSFKLKRILLVLACTACTYLRLRPFLSLISHMQRHTQSQGWWRDFYEIHSRKGTAGSDAWAAGKSQKYKIYCKQCWIHHLAAINDEHIQADRNGTFCIYPRGDQAISEYCSYSVFHVSTN
jgi:hypothetical protein